MALWTDGYFVTVDDLQAIDPEVEAVAAASGITLFGNKNSCIDKALQKIRSKLTTEMQRYGGYLSAGLVSGSHLAAVNNIGGPAANRTRILLNQIVVTWQYLPPVETLKEWVVHRTLVEFFRMAGNRTQIPADRMNAKQEEYMNIIQYEIWPQLQACGIPCVYRPMPTPAATFEINPGTWSVAVTPAISSSGGQFYVGITYVDQSRYIASNNKQNSESSLATLQNAVTSVPPNYRLTFNIANLNPPGAQLQDPLIPLCIVTPLNATGWNVYVGTDLSTMYLQNSTPIPIAQKTYTLLNDPVLGSSPIADDGQYPESYFTMMDLLQRA